MEDIFVRYRGQYLREGAEFSGGNQTHLLHSDNELEITMDIIPKGTVGCLYSLPNEAFEFNYILEGKLELCGPGEKQLLEAGDTFCYQQLKLNHMFRALKDTKIFCTSKSSCYSYNEESIEHLNEILTQLQKADGDTLLHCERVKGLSMGIAYFAEYDHSKLLDLFYAAKFHDVGKSRIPLEILLKPGKLTDEEYEIMKKHSLYTCDMISEYFGETVSQIASGHHERLDGKGYPNGLKGDEIALSSRILCVADAYDAMTITRPYRKGMSRQEAIEELRLHENTQFDPMVIDALEAYLIQDEPVSEG